jgi:hypothetical protein
MQSRGNSAPLISLTRHPGYQSFLNDEERGGEKNYSVLNNLSGEVIHPDFQKS